MNTYRPGTVSGVPVYVNYGRVEDFKYLKDLGMDLDNKICITRYGKNYR